MRTPSRTSPEPRTALIAHVARVQRTIRDCSGCGLCCTEAYNAQRILGLEADRIAEHLATLPARRRASLLARIDAVIARYALNTSRAKLYTCAFLDADFRCALPFDVKPLACLSFNPIERERCDQEQAQFDAVAPILERANRVAGYDDTLSAIPVAVKAAIKRRTRSKKPTVRQSAGR